MSRIMNEKVKIINFLVRKGKTITLAGMILFLLSYSIHSTKVMCGLQRHKSTDI